MKKIKIFYWVFTALIVLMDGVIPALTFQTPLAKAGISHLGYPDYFRVILTIFKIMGAIILIIPYFSARIKECSYAGFSFNFLCAALSHLLVDGLDIQVFFPILLLVILALSYYYYNKQGNTLLLKTEQPYEDRKFSTLNHQIN